MGDRMRSLNGRVIFRASRFTAFASLAGTGGAAIPRAFLRRAALRRRITGAYVSRTKMTHKMVTRAHYCSRHG